MGCRRTNKNNLKFFRVPLEDENACKIWAENLYLSDKILSKKTVFVCALHFDEKEIGQKRLKIGAIPIPVKYVPIDDNCKTAPKPKRPKRRCSVPNCKQYFQSPRLFTFPRHNTIRKKWIEFCSLKPDANCNNKFVCSYHFQITDFNYNNLTKRINKFAIPTIACAPNRKYCNFIPYNSGL